MWIVLELSKLKWVFFLRKAKGFSLGCCDTTRLFQNPQLPGLGNSPGRVSKTSRVPTPISKNPSAPRPYAGTYHHEELTSGVSQVKSRGSQSQIPPRGTFILTPLSLHQVRLRVRAPCVPEQKRSAPGAPRHGCRRLCAPAPPPLASAASGETH